jgi:PhnB protein
MARMPGVSAQLSVRRGREAVAWYQEAFGAREVHRVGGTDEEPSVVSTLALENTTFWVSDEAPEYDNHAPESLGGSTVRLLLETDDPHAVQARAVQLGAREVHPVGEFYGWLIGRIEDPFGHHWEIARQPTRAETSSQSA